MAIDYRLGMLVSAAMVLAAGCQSAAAEKLDDTYQRHASDATVVQIVERFADVAALGNVDGVLETLGGAPTERDMQRIEAREFVSSDGYTVTEVIMRKRLNADPAPRFFRVSVAPSPCLPAREVAAHFKLQEEGRDQTFVHGRGVKNASLTTHPYFAGLYKTQSLKVRHDEKFCTTSIHVVPGPDGPSPWHGSPSE